MRRSDKLKAIMPLVTLALDHIDALRPAERADVYEGIALALDGIHTPTSRQARATCDSIRAAECSQLSFRELFIKHS